MGTIESRRFDYDQWAALARENPEKFEEMRQREIEWVIQTAPIRAQQRLRCLQWRIDMERKKCGTPLSSCLRLYTMMWDRVTEERGFFSSLQLIINPESAGREWKSVKRAAHILPFVPNKSK